MRLVTLPAPRHIPIVVCLVTVTGCGGSGVQEIYRLGTPREHYQAAVQTLDTEIGRLLASIPEDVASRTNVIVMGDNGTPAQVLPPSVRPRQGKGTMFEPALHVPLIAAGPSVATPGNRCPAIVNSVDVFSTCVELLTGAPPPDDHAYPIDGVSLVPYFTDPGRAPLRDWILSEWFVPNHGGTRTMDHAAVRDERFKLVRNAVKGGTRLYDLAQDPDETVNLLKGESLEPEAAAALSCLESALAQIAR